MLGDNIESLKKMPDNYVDSVVTDPPYGLKFMGKKWDYEVPSIEFWKEVYRVLKPGGHVLSFGGTRTYHRMVVNIEDAGFEIRDQIQWIYGSGFPKSLNIGKAVDKIQGNEREVVGRQKYHRNHNDSAMDEYKRPCDIERQNGFDIDKGTSPHEGWGTALKPANEPICLARKPISEDTIAANVLKWGTGGINIDGCRVGNELISSGKSKVVGGGRLNLENTRVDIKETFSEGRFPANIIFDEEAAKMLDEQSGVSKGKPSYQTKTGGYQDKYVGGDLENGVDYKGYTDQGGASRFFYCAKVSKAERNKGLDGFEDKVIEGRDPGQDERAVAFKKRPTPTKNTHPTVKPIKLMSYLCRLITPKNGIVLDPFMGSGSTGISAKLEGFDFIGMEMDEEYYKIAEARINNYK